MTRLIAVCALLLLVLSVSAVNAQCYSVPAGWGPSPTIALPTGYIDDPMQMYASPVPTNMPLLTPMPDWLWKALTDDTVYYYGGTYSQKRYVPYSGYRSHYYDRHFQSERKHK